MKERICEICGKVFLPRSSGQKICGEPECRKKIQEKYRQNAVSREEIPEKKCPVCGKVFKPKRRRYVTCGPRCSAEYEKLKARNRRRARHPERNWNDSTETVCLCCGVVMTGSGAYEGYCSAHCQAACRNGSAWREFYPGTKGLIRKWSGEGLPVWQIAQLLGRHHSQIEEALGQ